MSGKKKESRWKRFLEKLHNPPNWVALLAVVSGVVVCPLLLFAIVFDYTHSMYTVVACVLCGVLLIYTTVVTVGYVAKLRKKVIKAAGKLVFARGMYQEYEFTTLFFAIFSFVCNVGYTLFLVFMALHYHSAWYGAIGIYYILLSVGRGFILLQNTKDDRRYRYDIHCRQAAKVRTYRYCGFMLIVLAFSLAFSVMELVIDNSGFRLAGWLFYVSAAVVVYKTILGLVHFIRSSRRTDLAVRSVRYINFAATLMTILCLQTSILAAYPPKDSTTAVVNGITGAIVCVITMALGIYVIMAASYIKKRLLAREVKKAEEIASSEGYNREDYEEEYIEPDLGEKLE